MKSYESQIPRTTDDYIQLAQEHDRLQQQYASAMRLMRAITGNPAHKNRATGRSTRLILRAMVAISEGNAVYLVAHSLRFAEQLRSKILLRCRSWHIPVETADVRAGVPNDNRDGFVGVVLVDHHVIDTMESHVHTKESVERGETNK